jgi:DNA-binding transcriptional MerR regulator
MEKTENSYRSSEAAKAAGITQHVLNEWVHRGLIQPAVPAPGQGASAIWDFKAIVLIRLMKLLVDAGMTRMDAGKIVSSDAVSSLLDTAIKRTVKIGPFGFKFRVENSLLQKPDDKISSPVWLMAAIHSGMVLADWYRNETERLKVLKGFEDVEAYTTVNLAAVINAVYSKLKG